MSQNLKTIKEHLKVLPLQKRLQAIEAIRREAFPFFSIMLNFETEKNNLLMGLFTFHYSRLGADYWFRINSEYYGK